MPVKVRGLDSLKRKLQRMGEGAIPILKVGMEAAGKVVENKTKDNITAKNLIVSGTMRRSVTTEVEADIKSVHAFVGPEDVPYARRVELGFSGRDRLGRLYNQPPRPYLRPALEQSRAAVKDELVAALRVLLRDVSA